MTTKTHCLKGHPLEGENLYVKPNGRRVCKICKRIHKTRSRQRRPETHRNYMKRRRASGSGKAYHQKYYETNKLRINFAAAVRHSMAGRKRLQGWQTMLGYTAHVLQRHLERQFLKGMTWGNYGKDWHIDHIQPLRCFEANDIRGAWALSNLRPLWKKANLTKGGTRTHLL